MKKVLLTAMSVAALVFTSCNNENEIEKEFSYTIPTTYSFERNGETSVSYSGQTTRILMGEEFLEALKVTTNTEAVLDGMFAHTEGNSDFSDADLNASSKSVRSKTAASSDYFSANTTDASEIKEDFDTWISAQVSEVFPNWSLDASEGVAGQIQEAGGGSTRYVSEKGLEYNQAINKALIGGLMVDQILNNYLSTSVLDADSNVADNDSETLETDKNYTTMEHKWDEAFGYLYGAEVSATSPVLGADSFLNKYLSRVEDDTDFAGISADIYSAFITGRAAIAGQDYTTRDEQAEILREKISEIVGVRAVYYLQQGKANLAIDKAGAFHDLSEGFGFVYSLQFTRKPNSTEPYFTKSEVDAFITTLMTGNGFWDVTEATLQTMSETIAAEFNFTLEEAAN